MKKSPTITNNKINSPPIVILLNTSKTFFFFFFALIALLYILYTGFVKSSSRDITKYLIQLKKKTMKSL